MNPLINIVLLMFAFLVLAGLIEVHQRKLVVPKSTSVVRRVHTHQTHTIFAHGSLKYAGTEIQIESPPEVLKTVNSRLLTSWVAIRDTYLAALLDVLVFTARNAYEAFSTLS